MKMTPISIMNTTANSLVTVNADITFAASFTEKQFIRAIVTAQKNIKTEMTGDNGRDKRKGRGL